MTEPYVERVQCINQKSLYKKDVHLHGGEMSKHNYLSGLISRHDGKWITVCTSDQNSIIIKKSFK